MAKLEILEFPDPRLRTVAKPVETVDDALRKLIDDMIETMYEASGIGLAASQVNVHKRVLVIDVSETRDQPQVFINPEITRREGEREIEEGCLSIPGYRGMVRRSVKVRAKARDRDGKQIRVTADDLLAHADFSFRQRKQVQLVLQMIVQVPRIDRRTLEVFGLLVLRASTPDFETVEQNFLPVDAVVAQEFVVGVVLEFDFLLDVRVAHLQQRVLRDLLLQVLLQVQHGHVDQLHRLI